MSYSIGRLGGDSRCCQPTEYGMDWIDYVDQSQAAVIELKTWINSLAPFARDHELGRIDDLMEAAAFGLLEDSGDATTPIRPIRADPDVYELRHKALSKKLRFYHGEPAELPVALVALHEHIKTTDAHQIVQINQAVARYHEGQPTRWDTI